eukprot:SAG31_NODE_4247_length_3420_cov_2.633243_1_plen_89_part_00
MVTSQPPPRALFLDFDSTISTPFVVERLGDWCVADRQHIFDAMTPLEIQQVTQALVVCAQLYMYVFFELSLLQIHWTIADVWLIVSTR